MSEKAVKPRNSVRRSISFVIFGLAVVLLVSAVVGLIIQGTGDARENMTAMRDRAVLHAASEGLVNKIAQEARADKLTELRKDKNFRKRGLDEVNAICDAAMEEARAEAEARYSNPVVQDPEAYSAAVSRLASVVSEASGLSDQERATYADIYVQLMENVVSWREIAPEGADDETITAGLIRLAKDLDKDGNRHLQAGFIRMAKDMAKKEQEQADAEEKNQALSLMSSSVENWSDYVDLDDDALWEKLTEEVSPLAKLTQFREDLIAGAKSCIQAVSEGKELPAWASEADEGAAISSDALVSYEYFVPTEALTKEQTEKDEAYQALQDRLISFIPDLGGLSDKLLASLRANIEAILSQGSQGFDAEYRTYAGYGGESALETSQTKIRFASMAKYLLLGGIALLLLGAVVFFWEKLTDKFGVPRTIIMLFFVYLCLLAEAYRINTRMMLGNVLERMTMYGVLVLAMMPGIQCGIGLNMGMTIRCISGLLGIVISLQLNMVGFGALMFACVCGVMIAVPLGWAYSILLNRMKGNEMTISTYVGFSFVSLMCIGWMLLPFNNPKIIWLLSGRGLRVTHSLLGSFAHLLDNALSFKIFGIKIPTGGLLFLAVCCVLMWLFSRSKTGIAMTAVGSNPRFAEASGISVNRMRTIGTMLSTVIAAVGIVIYSQAFGYAQLYTAPRQLGFIASSAILIGGATVRKAKVSHVLIGVFLFEGVLVFGQQIANAAVSGGGLSEVMRIMISNGIILYALTQTGGGRRD